MERYGNSIRASTYIPEHLAQKLNTECEKTRLSVSCFIARTLNEKLCGNTVEILVDANYSRMLELLRKTGETGAEKTELVLREQLHNCYMKQKEGEETGAC